MILLFVAETVLCATAAAVLFVISWRDGYTLITALLGVVLVPLLVLAMLAVRGLL